jgi:hypothetical protein
VCLLQESRALTVLIGARSGVGVPTCGLERWECPVEEKTGTSKRPVLILLHSRASLHSKYVNHSAMRESTYFEKEVHAY